VLSPLNCILAQKSSVTPVVCILTKSPVRKSFGLHTCANRGVGGTPDFSVQKPSVWVFPSPQLFEFVPPPAWPPVQMAGNCLRITLMQNKRLKPAPFHTLPQITAEGAPSQLDPNPRRTFFVSTIAARQHPTRMRAVCVPTSSGLILSMQSTAKGPIPRRGGERCRPATRHGEQAAGGTPALRNGPRTMRYVAGLTCLCWVWYREWRSSPCGRER